MNWEPDRALPKLSRFAGQFYRGLVWLQNVLVAIDDFIYFISPKGLLDVRGDCLALLGFHGRLGHAVMAGGNGLIDLLVHVAHPEIGIGEIGGVGIAVGCLGTFAVPLFTMAAKAMAV